MHAFIRHIGFEFEAHRNSTTGKMEFVSLSAIHESDGGRPLAIDDISEAYNNTSSPVTRFAYSGYFELASKLSIDDPIVGALAALGFDTTDILARCKTAAEVIHNV